MTKRAARRGWMWVVPAVLAALAGCHTAPAGHLVIAGGAISPENAGVYAALMAPLAPDATIGIVPTASGVPQESIAAAQKTLGRYANGRPVAVIDLTTQNPQDASAPAMAEAIDRCAALWFTGGDQSRIVAAFRPGSGTAGAGETPAYAAAKRVLSRGGVIAGSSAGAAMMCDPMIKGGRSDDALVGRIRQEGDDAGFIMGTGMGFFPYGLVDQHFLRRGRLGRLVAALEMSGLPRGYGVEENSALDVDLGAATIRVVGAEARAVLVDVSGVKREGNARRGVRVSLLNSGDQVDARTGAVTPLAARTKIARASGAAESAELPEAWAAGAVTLALQRLARDPGQPVVLRSAAFEVRFSADERTRVYVAAEKPEQITVVDAVLDIVPR